MSSILVVEHEARYRERVHDALTSEGWQVETVPDVASALRAAAAERPLLVLVANDLADARSLLDRFSRRGGGPGAVAMVAERDSGMAADTVGADELLTKPFTDKEIRLVVRRCLNAAARAATEATAGAHRFSSEELFGEMLAEVEESVPAIKTPAPPAPAPAPTLSGDLGSKLERTLSGLRDQDKARPAKPATPGGSKPGRSAGRELDDLISKTLAGLDTSAGRAKSTAGATAAAATSAASAPRPAPAAPVAAAPTAPPPMADTPAPAPAFPEATAMPGAASTGPGSDAGIPWEAPPLPEVHLPTEPAAPLPPPAVVPPRAAPPPSAAAPTPASASVAPSTKSGVTPSRRTGEIDLAQLEELARPRTKSGVRETAARPADAFGTQRIPTMKREAAAGEPREFGQYSLLERIAVGGMAEVWKARRRGVEGFQKTVAIKRILPHLTDSVDFVTMFIDEAKLAAQLTHNNIIHIYDLGKIGDDYFIAMEYVEGKDLRSILNAARNQGQPLPMGLALLVGARLASALDYAHRKRDFDNRELGLVHRDVSPQNVLIGFEGDIKLCDFGIVKAVSKASRTQLGALKGKLQYMSPEQAWGKSVDARSDIFSLGVLLFEMLTGRRLFTGDNEISVLEAVRDGRLQRPRDLLPAIPAEVDALVTHALAKDPDERFQTAGQMQKEMERILHGLHPAPTSADLAAYMHKLFAAEARDAGATLSESGVGAGQGQRELAEAGAKPAGVAAAGSAEAPVIVPKPGGVAGQEAEGKGKAVLFGAIAAAVLIGIGVYFWRGRATTPPAPAPLPASAPISAPATPPGTEPAAAAATPAATTGETPATVPPAAPAQPAVTPPATPAAALAAKQEELRRLEAQKRELDAQAKKAADQKPTPAASTPPEPAAPPAAEPEPAAPQVEPEPVPSTPPQREPEPVTAAPEPPPAAPAAPKVNQGDLVTMGPGVVPPALVSAPNPTYPPAARQRGIEGNVSVQVLVDENGAVRETKLLKGPGVGLNESAMEAARRARFRPGTKDGVRVKMWFTLNFPFQLD